MKKIELLAPAGSLDRLKVAIDYGADAVYIGGESFSLRARANNFSLEDIKEACIYAKKHKAKVYVTCNVLPHNDDLDNQKLVDYLKYLENVGVDAIIASSIHIIDTCLKICKKMEVHVSTQASVTNSYALKAYEELGVKRVVLGREVSLENIERIRNNTNIGIEVFIHGGMCSSISGRCMLSNHMVNRDANRGGCAHSCRWNYDLYEDREKLNKDIFFNIGSKDLCASNYISKLIECGVDSLKIEGRMKSEYYLATIVRSYRNIIDEYYHEKEINIDRWNNEINRAENRLTCPGFLNGKIVFEEQLYDRDDHPTKEFVGRVIKYNRFKKEVTIKQRNYFTIGDTLEIFSLNKEDFIYKVDKIYDSDYNELDAARHPEQIIKLKNVPLCHEGSIVRLIKNNE